jgi:hypothetical protein
MELRKGNNLNFNLAVFIHAIGPEPVVGTGSQTTKEFKEDVVNLEFPVGDVTASGFYIPNTHNNLLENAASGLHADQSSFFAWTRQKTHTLFYFCFTFKGWAGFAFSILPTPLQFFRNSPIKPAEPKSLNFDWNTAHSTGWWVSDMLREECYYCCTFKWFGISLIGSVGLSRGLLFQWHSLLQ